MIKKSILLLAVSASIGFNATAQKCATDEVFKDYAKLNPAIEQIRQSLDDQWRGVSSVSKTTSGNNNFNAWQQHVYDSMTSKRVIIPVVVHVIHDFGSEYVPDNTIHQMIKELNLYYSGTNTDISQVIQPFKKYVGRSNIEFRLAQKDPVGNATTGITRRRSYLTKYGDDQAKMDLWAPSRYLNIWVINTIGRGANPPNIVLAYATLPAGAAAFPFSDGVISRGDRLTNDVTIAHEVGHYLNLYHPWNNSGRDCGAACGDDEVDDTPPTKGHQSNCPLNDTACATGYAMQYSFFDVDSNKLIKVIEDYPDTTNTQNIMDYSSCTNMFTKQQAIRQRVTLTNNIANRNNLVSASNLAITGVGDTTAGSYVRNDMKPVPEFSVEKGLGTDITAYLCVSEVGNPRNFYFKNQSWRDTVTSVEWTFENGTPATSTNMTGPFTVSFNKPGWATVTLKATGNNTGDSTITRKPVYVADISSKIDPLNGYYQEFNNATENERWPIFNYYENDNKWEVTNQTGFYDNSCIVYRGFDKRNYPTGLVGTPAMNTASGKNGDFDDFFTPAFDLSGMKDYANCNLNFMFAGAWRVSASSQMNDELEISYSTNCGQWTSMKTLTKADLVYGTYANEFAPLSMNDWYEQNINIPALARVSNVMFRFRYKPTTDNTTLFYLGNGNNYYMDRINVSPYATSVKGLHSGSKNIGLAPNPTNTDAKVIISNNINNKASVTVTDMTGKVVYRTEKVLASNMENVEIPASAIAVKGFYMVQIVAGTESKTEKLVSY